MQDGDTKIDPSSNGDNSNDTGPASIDIERPRKRKNNGSNRNACRSHNRTNELASSCNRGWDGWVGNHGSGGERRAGGGNGVRMLPN